MFHGETKGVNKLKSTLEKFREHLFKKGLQGDKNELKRMDLIVSFLRGNEELNNQIMSNATKTIKTIQPSILLNDFGIAMSMTYAIVANAIFYLVENGYLEIKDEEVK